jgi:hypothetical protein
MDYCRFLLCLFPSSRVVNTTPDHGTERAFISEKHLLRNYKEFDNKLTIATYYGKRMSGK